MPTTDHAEHDDEAEQQECVDETDDREIRAELRLVSRGHVQHDDAGDEEHQQECADQLGEISRKSSFLHVSSS